MSTCNVQIATGRSSLRQKIDLFFTGLGLGMNPYGLQRARMQQRSPHSPRLRSRTAMMRSTV